MHLPPLLHPTRIAVEVTQAFSEGCYRLCHKRRDVLGEFVACLEEAGISRVVSSHIHRISGSRDDRWRTCGQ